MRCIVFDLDGTLTKSDEGILNCIDYAVEKVGLSLPDKTDRAKFVGPPLIWSFKTYCGMDDETASRALVAYRERYMRIGLYENRVYPGIRRLLRLLRRRGDWIAIATGKPTVPSKRIIAHFGLERYFDRIVGADDVLHPDKEDLIRAALPETCDEAVMVGDRSFDVLGGKAAGIRTVGVGYGFGTEEELRGAGCDNYAADVDELIALLCLGETQPRGAFISMEGPDGSGKSTQASLLAEALDRYGFEVIRSREPGGSPVGERIREVLLSPESGEMAPETEALLFAASRAEHVRKVIRPTVAAGKVLLCDRFLDSSVAYQGGGRGLGLERVLRINEEAVVGCLPDATVYLDVDHRIAMGRRVKANAPDRMEREEEAFHARVEEAYHQLIDMDTERFVVVDANREAQAIGEEISRRVIGRLTALEEEADR